MSDNKLKDISNKELNIKHIKITDMDKVDDYLFIALDTKQKILTNGTELYDVSEYNHLLSMFHMGDKFCAVMTKHYSLCLVELKTMEVLFEDSDAYHISKQDRRTLNIIMKVGCGNNTIYDIETKKYLPVPDNYKFENSLGNNLYVFREENDSDTNFYDYKRCVINADGKIILKDIAGWIELSNNHLIISKKKELCIARINEDSTLDMKIIKQSGKFIVPPKYHNGNIIIIEKGVIKIYTLDLEITNEFFVDKLNTIIDYEIISNTLKICLPYTVNKEQLDKHLFINLNTGKSISHSRIESYPYWVPKTYVGQDNINSETTDYHFYNAAFESIVKVSANSYESIESNKECMFVIKRLDGENEYKQLLNTENGSIKDIDYDYIHFHPSLPYGYGVNLSTEKTDFFDETLNVIIPNFDYKKFNTSYFYDKFDYVIINKYICIYSHYTDDYGKTKWRTIVQKEDGEVIVDSVQHKCCAIGNFIQIIHNGDSKFLNTITGELGTLGISATVDETEKINLKKITNVNNILSISDTSPLKLPSTEKEQPPKVKKLLPNHK